MKRGLSVFNDGYVTSDVPWKLLKKRRERDFVDLVQLYTCTQYKVKKSNNYPSYPSPFANINVVCLRKESNKM